MTEHADREEPMTPEQADELRTLAEAAGEDVPTYLPAVEAAERIAELRAHLGR